MWGCPGGTLLWPLSVRIVGRIAAYRRKYVVVSIMLMATLFLGSYGLCSYELYSHGLHYI